MKKKTEAIIHILIWVIGYFLILSQTSTIGDFRKDTGPYWIPLLFGMIINQTIFYTTAFYLVPKFLRLKKTKTLIVLVLAGLIGITLFESFIDYNYLVNFFSSDNETFTVYFLYNLFVGFIILLIALSYALLKYWIQNEKMKRVLLEEKLSTEMAFLKSKINPHFLFNVLNSFYAKSLKHDVPELADGIARLAELMRYMVYETNEDKVILEKEIHHLKNFIQVYQLRIAEEDDVFINFSVNGDVNAVKISPMLLIPLVENAIKHGIEPNTKSVIDISLEIRKNKLYFEVNNTVHGLKNGIEDESSGFGLDNLKKRLSILYPNAYTLETKEEKGFFKSFLSLNLE
ncbi:histidine kinase [Algoriphagus sp. SE2]|uniref:sensor histidine kinase n=1 Tax=Algoriphagus sp. SE2 TaxID=3141536 RepID=UPI0031CD0A8A